MLLQRENGLFDEQQEDINENVHTLPRTHSTHWHARIYKRVHVYYTQCNSEARGQASRTYSARLRDKDKSSVHRLKGL